MPASVQNGLINNLSKPSSFWHTEAYQFFVVYKVLKASWKAKNCYAEDFFCDVFNTSSKRWMFSGLVLSFHEIHFFIKKPRSFWGFYISSKSPDPFGSLPIIEVSSRSPESKNNLLNFQNVNGIIFISFSLTFLIFHVDFFSKVTRKSAGSKDLAFAL